MKFYLEPLRAKNAKDGKQAIVIRGRDRSGNPYRIFLTSVFKDAKVKKEHWNQDKQTVSGNPTLKATLDAIKTKLKNKVLEQSPIDPSYDIPSAWASLYKPEENIKKGHRGKAPEKIIELLPIYQETYKGKRSDGYLRIFDQLKGDIKKWNKDWTFSNLNELNLLGYEAYLNGKDEKCERSPLHLSSIYNHFKLLKVLAKFAQLKSLKVDPTVFQFKVKYVHTQGGFALTFDELMKLWFYKPIDWFEELSKDLFLFEAFTGIRSGDISRLQNGDIQEDFILYRDKKNNLMEKVVTLHKFNREIIARHKQDSPSALLFPPIAQQTVNETIKAIAKSAGLVRNIRRGNEFSPVHEVISTHCGRHGYASLLSRIGVPADYVKAELGHSQGGTTFGTYVHRDDQHELVRELVDELPMKPSEGKEVKLSLKKIA